jgi:hypothetical protein
MCEMVSYEGRHAVMYSDKTREPLLLPWRESAIGSKDVVAGHKSSPGNDQVRNGDGEVGGGGGTTKTGSVAIGELTNTTQPQPADPALAAEDGTLNTWRR